MPRTCATTTAAARRLRALRAARGRHPAARACRSTRRTNTILPGGRVAGRARRHGGHASACSADAAGHRRAARSASPPARPRRSRCWRSRSSTDCRASGRERPALRAGLASADVPGRPSEPGHPGPTAADESGPARPRRARYGRVPLEDALGRASEPVVRPHVHPEHVLDPREPPAVVGRAIGIPGPLAHPRHVVGIHVVDVHPKVGAADEMAHPHDMGADPDTRVERVVVGAVRLELLVEPADPVGLAGQDRSGVPEQHGRLLHRSLRARRYTASSRPSRTVRLGEGTRRVRRSGPRRRRTRRFRYDRPMTTREVASRRWTVAARQTEGQDELPDRLLGRTPQPTIQVNTLRPPRPVPSPDADAVAVERYRYLLRTAPPEDLERAHVEAFERLTPEQRAQARRVWRARSPRARRP